MTCIWQFDENPYDKCQLISDESVGSARNPCCCSMAIHKTNENQFKNKMICSARDPRCCWCGNHGRPSSLSWISSNTRFWNTEVILDSSILVILDLIINSWTFQSLIGNNEHSWGWDLGRNKIYHDRCRVSTNQTKPTIIKKLTIEQPINCVCVVNKPRRMQRKLWWCFLLITGPETATSAHLNSQRNESLSQLEPSPPSPPAKPQTQQRPTQAPISPNFPRFDFLL